MASSEPSGVRFSVRSAGPPQNSLQTDQPQTGGLNVSSPLPAGLLWPRGDRPIQAPLMRFSPLQHMRPHCADPGMPGPVNPASAFVRPCGLPLNAAMRPSPALLHSGRFLGHGHSGAARRGHSSPDSSRATSQADGHGLRVALPQRSALRQRSWGFVPFAALFLRPGQRDVSITRTPPAVSRKPASIGFRRGVGRVFYLLMAADPRLPPRLLGFSPVQCGPRLLRQRRSCPGLSLFQVFGHRLMHRRQSEISRPRAGRQIPDQDPALSRSRSCRFRFHPLMSFSAVDAA